MSTQAVAHASTSSVPVKIKAGPQQLLTDMEDFAIKVAERAFALFEGRGRQDGHDVCDWCRAEAELFGSSALQIEEADDRFTVRAQVPGFEVKDLNVALDNGTLFISGKSEHKSGKNSEYRQYYQRLDLPQTVNVERATATLHKGVLELTLPKSPARIDVKSAA